MKMKYSLNSDSSGSKSRGTQYKIVDIMDMMPEMGKYAALVSGSFCSGGSSKDKNMACLKMYVSGGRGLAAQWRWVG